VSTVHASNLRRGTTTSCGCRRREVSAALLTTHGLSRAGRRKQSRLYGIWSDMRRRCMDPARREYPNYGGRGITICAEWAEFPAFHAWALESGYRRALSLDRIDNDGPYSPDNCRWADRHTQARNTRLTLTLEHENLTLPLVEWAERAGISPSTLKYRIRAGWPISQALATPVRGAPS
jgi:hypothetical protein